MEMCLDPGLLLFTVQSVFFYKCECSYSSSMVAIVYLLWCIHRYLLTYLISRSCVTFDSVAESYYNPKTVCILPDFLWDVYFWHNTSFVLLDWSGFTSYNHHLYTCEASTKSIRLLSGCNFISAVSKALSLSENS